MGDYSSYGSKPSLPDYLSIAPPPEVPMPQDYSQSLFNVEESADHNLASKPCFGRIRHSGICLARISKKSLLTKKWKQVFWITYDESVLIFKTKDKFDDWVMNPHLSSRQREDLVKLRVDFRNENPNRISASSNIKGYQISPIKMKRYSFGGTLAIHQFKLDKWVDDGPMIAAAFGSENLSTTNELHRVISIMIRNSPSSSILAGRGYSSDADSSGYFSSGQSLSAWDDASSVASGFSAKSARSSVSIESSSSRGKYILGNIRAAIASAHDKMEGGMER